MDIYLHAQDDCDLAEVRFKFASSSHGEQTISKGFNVIASVSQSPIDNFPLFPY